MISLQLPLPMISRARTGWSTTAVMLDSNGRL